MIQTDSQIDKRFAQTEIVLRDRIQSEEAEHGRNSKPPDSLWEHALRVASVAERLGVAEEVDSAACRLAGLFHDAGKFKGGGYHLCDEPEEVLSVEVLREITANKGFEESLIKQVEESILQLYRDEPEPNLLTKILFDADNLDKLGFLGVANFCVKAGLRGKCISPSFFYRITVELTYARHAPVCLATKAGRQLAVKRAPETVYYFKKLLESLREDGIHDFRIKEITYDGLIIDVVSPKTCSCGAEPSLKIEEIPGLKCSEIHLHHICDNCGGQHELHFCRPRLMK
jgi:hypothetical protein